MRLARAAGAEGGATELKQTLLTTSSHHVLSWKLALLPPQRRPPPASHLLCSSWSQFKKNTTEEVWKADPGPRKRQALTQRWLHKHTRLLLQ